MRHSTCVVPMNAMVSALFTAEVTAPRHCAGRAQRTSIRRKNTTLPACEGL